MSTGGGICKQAMEQRRVAQVVVAQARHSPHPAPWTMLTTDGETSKRREERREMSVGHAEPKMSTLSASDDRYGLSLEQNENGCRLSLCGKPSSKGQRCFGSVSTTEECRRMKST